MHQSKYIILTQNYPTQLLKSSSDLVNAPQCRLIVSSSFSCSTFWLFHLEKIGLGLLLIFAIVLDYLFLYICSKVIWYVNNYVDTSPTKYTYNTNTHWSTHLLANPISHNLEIVQAIYKTDHCLTLILNNNNTETKNSNHHTSALGSSSPSSTSALITLFTNVQQEPLQSWHFSPPK